MLVGKCEINDCSTLGLQVSCLGEQCYIKKAYYYPDGY